MNTIEVAKELTKGGKQIQQEAAAGNQSHNKQQW